MEGANLRDELSTSGRISRRRFLTGAAATGLVLAAGSPVWAQPSRSGSLPEGLFSLGVASGDPLPDGAVLWTKLAPEPLKVGGGMPTRPVPVRWEVAEDERFRRVVRSGEETAVLELGHSVHAEVSGLRPDRWYYYRFRAGREISPAGRTKTAPAPGASPAALAFAFASCQQWQSGYYAAYRRMAEEDLDLVVHIGDYIYEGSINDPGVRPELPPEAVRPEPTTLDGYRLRYGLYQSDPELQAAHAAFPWAVTWDDHEVDNNWAGSVPQDPDRQSPEEFEDRRAAAFQAYYEHLPLRRSARPRGTDMRLYRRLTFGDLAEFSVTDTRQYRDDQGCGPGDRVPPCPDFYEPERQMLGEEQERWLFDGLGRSRARWNAITAQVIMAQFDYEAGEGRRYSGDKWDGYYSARQRLLEFVDRRGVANPVVITGDAHINLASDLNLDFGDPASKTVAAEFTGTAITSGGVNAASDAEFRKPIDEAGHIKYYEGTNRGYVRCIVNRDEWRSDYRAVATDPATTRVLSPDAPVRTQASWVVESGNPGPERA